MPVVTVVLLFTNILIHVIRGNDDSCNELVNHPENFFPDDERIDALNLTVECTNSSAEVLWERTNHGNDPLGYINIEYTCFNESTGKNTTTNIVNNREIHATEKDSETITVTNPDNCIFRACISLIEHFDNYAWNLDSAKCQEALDPTSSSMSQLIDSSMRDLSTAAIHPTELQSQTMLTSSLSLPQPTQPTQSTVSSSPSITSTTTSLTIIESSTFIVIFVLVLLIGGAGLAVLMVVCLSYWRWLRMTTSIRYDCKFKDEELPHHSVSFYSIDNISTTGSNVTVLHSLTIKCPEYEEKINEIDLVKGMNIKNSHFDNNVYQTNQSNEELDYTSDCSTVSDIKYVNTMHKCLESPVISVEARVEGSGSITSSFDRNEHLDNDGYLQDSNSSESHGYLQENNSSETFAAQILSHMKQSSPVCDDYIPDSSSDNQKDPTYLPSCLIGHHSCCESAYVSGASTSSSKS